MAMAALAPLGPIAVTVHRCSAVGELTFEAVVAPRYVVDVAVVGRGKNIHFIFIVHKFLFD